MIRAIIIQKHIYDKNTNYYLITEKDELISISSYNKKYNLFSYVNILDKKIDSLLFESINNLDVEVLIKVNKIFYIYYKTAPLGNDFLLISKILLNPGSLKSNLLKFIYIITKKNGLIIKNSQIINKFYKTNISDKEFIELLNIYNEELSKIGLDYL